MLHYGLLALAGCFLGVVTGLLPGLHVNTVAVLGLSMYAAFGLDPVGFAVVLTSLSITHAFLDFLPAIFLGAPEEDTALSVLPAHRLYMRGRALEAVKLTAIGSLLGLSCGLLLLIPAFYIIPPIYRFSRGFIGYILILAVGILILKEKRGKKWALAIFLLSGMLGYIALNIQTMLSTTEVLFPVFAGLFGLSTLLDSLNSRTSSVPQEEHIRVGMKPGYVGSGLLGALSGALIGILPAISPSQLGVLVSEFAALDTACFLVFISAINTADAIYSILALYTIGNPRSGVGVIVGKVLEVDYDTVLLLVGVMAFSAFFAAASQIWVGRRMTKILSKVDYRRLCMASISVILAMIFLFTGFFGLGLALLCTVIGLLPIYSGVSRTHLMGVLLLPTIIFFL